MNSFDILSETPNSINTSSYLSSKESSVLIANYVTESVIINSPNKVYEVSIYNTQKQQTNFSTITSSIVSETIEYTYSDVDDNVFNTTYNVSSSNYIVDVQNNALFDMAKIVADMSITANNFYVSINPMINLLSTNNGLTIKEISNSKKEISLIRNFPIESIVNDLTVNFSKNEIFVNGLQNINLKAGSVYYFNVTGDLSLIKFSLIKDGPANNGVAYNTGILFQPRSNRIVINTTDGFPSVLYLYNKNVTNSGVTLNFSDKLDQKTFLLNTEFYSFDSNSYITNQIYDLVQYYLKAFEVSSLFNTTKENFSDDLTALKHFYNFSGDGQVFDFINSVYYGETVVDKQTNTSVVFVGIYDYILNYLKYNYNFLDDFDNLNAVISNIATQAIIKKLIFLNKNSLVSKPNQELFTKSYKYLFEFFDSFLQNIQSVIKSKFVTKFKSPLSNALNFGNNVLFPIISSKIIINASEDYIVVKLKNPLSDNFSVGDTCQISNISMVPFFQKVYFESKKTANTIKLSAPNFGLKFDDNPKNTAGITYYNSSSLSSQVSSTQNNQIALYKSISELNVDYSNFSNFIIFSSANARVTVFENKMIKLSSLDNDITLLNSVISSSTVSGQVQSKQNEKNCIIRGFDGYESYLYNTGQFLYDTASGLFVDPTLTGSFTKTKSSYVSSLEADSVQYDVDNSDSLINNTPEFIYLNTDNDDYLKFLTMVGHQFDNIYIYIANLPVLRKTEHQDNLGSSKNITHLILDSFGFKVPPNIIGQIENSDLITNYLDSSTVNNLGNSTSIDSKTKSIWKRLLINLPAIYKSKGTEECLRQIFSCYGIPSNLITIKEFGGGYTSPDISSTYLSQDKIYLLDFLGTSNEYFQVNGLYGYQSIDFKVSLKSLYYTSNYQIIQIFSKVVSSTQTLSFGIIKYENALGSFYLSFKDSLGNKYTYITDKLDIFTDEVISVLIRKNNVNPIFDSSTDPNAVPTQYDIIIRKNGTDVDLASKVYSFYLSTTLNALFQATGSLYFGNFTSTFSLPSQINVAYMVKNFAGSIDKVIIETSPLSNVDFFNRSNNLNYYSDSLPSSTYQNILFRLDLGIPVDISKTSIAGVSYPNGSPVYSQYSASLYNFIGENYGPKVVNCISQSVSVFPHQTTQYDVVNRYDTSNVGASRFENDKINKVSVLSTDNSLSPINSRAIKNNTFNYKDTNKIGIFLSPVQERNKKILDFFGSYNIMSEMYDPANRYVDKYDNLTSLKNDFYTGSFQSKIRFNELFTMYKIYVDKSIFTTLKNVLPSRNKIYEGILIEPSILEKSQFNNKPVAFDQITELNATINLSNIIDSEQGGEVISLHTASISNIISDKNDSYSREFSGFYAVQDSPDDYQFGLFSDNGYTELNGVTYQTFIVYYKKTATYSRLSEPIVKSTKLFKKINVVDVSSVVPFEQNIINGSAIPLNYSPMIFPYLNNISSKSLPLRKVIYHPIDDYDNTLAPLYKSRQTELTTISNDQSLNRSPIILTTVGNAIRTTISGKVVGS